MNAIRGPLTRMKSCKISRDFKEYRKIVGIAKHLRDIPKHFNKDFKREQGFSRYFGDCECIEEYKWIQAK